MLRSIKKSVPQKLPRFGAEHSHEFKAKNVSLVLLKGLPTTASMTDIRALTYKHPWQPSGEAHTTPRDSSSRSLAASIATISFIRTKMLNPSGKVLVRFYDADKAREFADAANERMIGGNKIKAEITSRRPKMAGEVVSLLTALQMQSPGRVVLLKGLPLNLSEEHLGRILSRQYDLAGDKVEWTSADGNEHMLQAVVKVNDYFPHRNFSTFLIRFATVTGAMTLVRRWHRMAWRGRYQEMKKGKQTGLEFAERQAVRLEEDNGFDNVAEIDGDELQWRDTLRQSQQAEGNSLEITPQHCIVDAYMMH